jgi:acylpyruvate hydrolase
MRLATVRYEGASRAAVITDKGAQLLAHSDVGALLADGDWRRTAESSTAGPVIDPDSADYAPVVPQPEKIICVGLNYYGHAKETGHEPPTHPQLFAKYWRSLIGAYDDIQLPAESTRVDWEAEVGLVIGQPLRHASEEQAEVGIAGYTVVNDVSMRDWQGRTGQYLQGKTFEAATPVGPALVTPDEFGDIGPARIRCEVNGELMQDSLAGDMIFGPGQVVSYISTFITLVPGDLIAMGTPAGIGSRRKPPQFLQPGDILTTSLEGVGTERNMCRMAHHG